MNDKKGKVQPNDSITAMIVTKWRTNIVGLIGGDLFSTDDELVLSSVCGSDGGDVSVGISGAIDVNLFLLLPLVLREDEDSLTAVFNCKVAILSLILSLNGCDINPNNAEYKNTTTYEVRMADEHW